MLHTSTRSHCKLGTAFKQMHSAGIWSNVGVWHSLATGVCPEFSERTQCSGFKLAPALQNGNWLCREAYALHAYNFLQQIWGQHEYKCHSVLWHRASLGFQGLLARDLLWANMAILLIRCSWQWQQGSCVQHWAGVCKEPGCGIRSLCCRWSAHDN